MGYTAYCADTRLARAETKGYYTKSIGEVFVQQKERRIHESMDPKSIELRECRDSATHPMTTPVVIGLDVTGSMHQIPANLIKDGLPTMVSSAIQAGVKDVAILFTAIGDAECDRYPLQVGQFESGDVELDTWLTRTYLEGGGGGNAGESYHLVWDFVSRSVVTDAWDKRRQKGIIVTIGDEPVLSQIPSNLLTEVYGKGQFKTVTNTELLEKLQEKWHVYHIHVNHGYRGEVDAAWKQLLGQNVITTKHHTEVPKIIAELIAKHGAVVTDEKEQSTSQVAPVAETEVIL